MNRWTGIGGRRSALYNNLATDYGLDDPGFESRQGKGVSFPKIARPVPWAAHSPIQWLPKLYSEVKAAGTWGWPLPSASSLRISGALHLFPFCMPSWHGQRQLFILPLEVVKLYFHSLKFHYIDKLFYSRPFFLVLIQSTCINTLSGNEPGNCVLFLGSGYLPEHVGPITHNLCPS